MNILIVTDFSAYKYQGKLFVGTQFSTIVKRYRDAFGSVSLSLRVHAIESVPPGFECAEDFISNYYPIGSLIEAYKPSYKKLITELIKSMDLIVIRCPSMIGLVAARIARNLKKTYLSELMGDAWDGYWSHGFGGKFVAPFAYWETKRLVRKGNYALYVTSEWLQKRYPCGGVTVSASNVLLQHVDDSCLIRKKEVYSTDFAKREIRIMTTGAIDIRHKGQEFVIRAIPRLNRIGLKVKYYLAGGGSDKYLSSVAKECNVQDQVVFLGRLGLEDVFNELDKTDIYIQPSLQEGLPRSVIEAMSKACLVIGSRTAGTPELVVPECVVERRSVSDIVNKIYYLCDIPAKERALMSERNFQKSKEFLAEVLDERRNVFYKKVLEDLQHSK